MTKAVVVGVLVTVLALGVTATEGDTTSGAQSHSVWLCRHKVVAAAGECVVKAEAVEAIVFEDRAPGVELSIECTAGELLGEGWVGPGGEAKVRSVSTRECTEVPYAFTLREKYAKNMCVRLESFRAVGLPWDVSVEYPGGVPYARVRSGGNGPPGFSITCAAEVGGLAFKVVDTCRSAPSHEVRVQLLNVLPSEAAKDHGQVPPPDIQFQPPKLLLDGEAEFATCALGGRRAGLARGELTLTPTVDGAPATLELGDQ
ncbi:MAG TPA: hypothetical protein VK790_06785 [Solirubrobacteraceae bacterium]|jgi:hypothetical protein|nr:hypothetical protein [Solirubrobacteraceae bacterium]